MEQIARFFPPETPGIICLGTLVLGVFGLLIRNSLRRREVAASWDDLAFRMGLSYELDPQEHLPFISGEYRGRPIRVERSVAGRGIMLYTYISMLFRSRVENELALIHQEYAATDTVLRPGVPDVQIGSEKFDRYFIVKCQSPEFAISALNDAPLQESLIALDDACKFLVKVGHKKLTCTLIDLPDDVALLEKAVVIAGDLADRVDKPLDEGQFFRHSAIDENWDDDDEA